MPDAIMPIYDNFLSSIQTLLMCLTVLLHLIFASAVAKDSGELDQTGIKPALVSGLTWAFATLVGGVLVAALYWFIHHSKLTRA